MKKITIAVSVAVIAFAASAYASPYYALHQIKTALAERNAETLATHVDFPALRASVKAQLEASMARSIEATAGSGNPLAALGQSIAGAMLGKMVDTMVSPAGVVALVNKSAVSPQAEQKAMRMRPPMARRKKPGTPQAMPASTPSSSGPRKAAARTVRWSCNATVCGTGN